MNKFIIFSTSGFKWAKGTKYNNVQTSYWPLKVRSSMLAHESYRLSPWGEEDKAGVRSAQQTAGLVIEH